MIMMIDDWYSYHSTYCLISDVLGTPMMIGCYSILLWYKYHSIIMPTHYFCGIWVNLIHPKKEALWTEKSPGLPEQRLQHGIMDALKASRATLRVLHIASVSRLRVFSESSPVRNVVEFVHVLICETGLLTCWACGTMWECTGHFCNYNR